MKSYIFTPRVLRALSLTFSLIAASFSEGKCQTISDQPVVYDQAIEDNSYFIEEAYNQEDRVVQHISNGYLANPEGSRSFIYSFTQEWPFTSQAHQVSATVSYAAPPAGVQNGLGDIALNYRYQLFTKANWAAFSPRLSLLIPTGGEVRGVGVWGVQVNLPASKRLSNEFVMHLNTGMTILPGVKSEVGPSTVHRNLLWYNAGVSLIWLAQPNFNVMLESVGNFTSEIGTDGDVRRMEEMIVSPGFRFAVDIGQLQVVPGLAFPVSLSAAGTSVGTFFYLSFEHPY
jgi:hypothetical protein